MIKSRLTVAASVALLGASGVLGSCGPGCGKVGNAVLDTPSEKPRNYIVFCKSYRGSREMLVDTAASMLQENPRFGEMRGGHVSELIAPKGGEPEFLVFGHWMQGTASVSEILALLRAIEERLNPAHDRDPNNPALKMELWWVQGIHERADGIELPNPQILREAWAAKVFAHASDVAMEATMDHGLEQLAWVLRVARAYKYADESERLQPLYEGDFDAPTMRWEDGTFVYTNYAQNHADAIATSANLAFLAGVHYARYMSDPQVRAEQYLHDHVEVGADEIRMRRSELVEPIRVAVPLGTGLGQRAALWIAATRKVAGATRLAPVSSVVFDNLPTEIIGALVGERASEQQLFPDAPLEDAVTVERIDSRRHAYQISLRLSPPSSLPEPQPPPDHREVLTIE